MDYRSTIKAKNSQTIIILAAMPCQGQLPIKSSIQIAERILLKDLPHARDCVLGHRLRSELVARLLHFIFYSVFSCGHRVVTLL